MRKSNIQLELPLGTLFWDTLWKIKFVDPFARDKSVGKASHWPRSPEITKCEIRGLSISANFAASELKINMWQNYV